MTPTMAQVELAVARTSGIWEDLGVAQLNFSIEISTHFFKFASKKSFKASQNFYHLHLS